MVLSLLVAGEQGVQQLLSRKRGEQEQIMHADDRRIRVTNGAGDLSEKTEEELLFELSQHLDDALSECKSLGNTCGIPFVLAKLKLQGEPITRLHLQDAAEPCLSSKLSTKMQCILQLLQDHPELAHRGISLAREKINALSPMDPRSHMLAGALSFCEQSVAGKNPGNPIPLDDQ